MLSSAVVDENGIILWLERERESVRGGISCSLLKRLAKIGRGTI